MTDENHWRTTSFRQSVVTKIDEAVARSGMPTLKNSMEMENHVFQKAKTKEEYLAFVARLILHVREMKTKNPGAMAGNAVPGQMMQDPINALQTLARQGTGNNQMMGMNAGAMPPGAMNPQGMNPGGMNAQVLNAGGMNPQGMNPGGLNPQGMNPNEMGGGVNVNVGMVRQPTPQNTASNLLQTLNQRPPPGQMMGLQGMQNKVGGLGMNPGQQGGPMGQMAGAQQMQGMNMGQIGMGMGGQMMNHMQQRKPNEMMMANQTGGGFMGPRGNAPPNQFLRQSPSPSAQSPVGMGAQIPASPALVPSPSGPQLSSGMGGIGGPRSNGMSGIVQSPGSSLNTPQQSVSTSSPGNILEEQQYREKVRQLSKYIEPLRRMIARMGNDDVEKLSKMKKLLEILSNPSKRMPLETLKKCEVVLEKMDLKRGEGGSVGPFSGHMATMKEMGHCNPLLEAVSNCLQSSVNNHTLQRTFGPTLETLFGHEIKSTSPNSEASSFDEPKTDVPEVLQGEIARLDQRFKVSLDGTHLPGSAAVRLICSLDDKYLPAVPPVYVSVPADYPKHPPRCSFPQEDYSATDFLSAVLNALSLRVRKLPSRYSLSQLLDAWEMSVRQACAPCKGSL